MLDEEFGRTLPIPDFNISFSVKNYTNRLEKGIMPSKNTKSLTFQPQNIVFGIIDSLFQPSPFLILFQG